VSAEDHLVITALTKRYQSVAALDGVDLTIRRGELLTLLGPSGCGKTTLLRAVAGFNAQDEGSISVAGRSLDGVPPHRRDFGMVFQNYAIFPHLTVADNVAYGLRARGVGREDIRRRVAASLEKVQLGHLAQRFPDAMSGGQKQRVGLARAMVIEPELLLMDEPLSNLDAKLRIEMRQQIRLMQREQGISTLYVTHDQEEAMAISDRIAVMRGGRIEQLGTPEAIYENPETSFVADFVGGSNWLDAVLEGRTLRHGAGESIVLPDSFALAGHPGGAVRISLRAEDLDLAGAGDMRPNIAGTVLVRSYLGRQTRLRVRLADGVEIDADVVGAAPPAEGETVRLGFAAEDIRLFDTTSGARIR
jgi:ABC-type Fe3+/spermidine/putrescine transport system ATPase subunit